MKLKLVLLILFYNSRLFGQNCLYEWGSQPSMNGFVYPSDLTLNSQSPNKIPFSVEFTDLDAKKAVSGGKSCSIDVQKLVQEPSTRSYTVEFNLIQKGNYSTFNSNSTIIPTFPTPLVKKNIFFLPLRNV